MEETIDDTLTGLIDGPRVKILWGDPYTGKPYHELSPRVYKRMSIGTIIQFSTGEFRVRGSTNTGRTSPAFPEEILTIVDIQTGEVFWRNPSYEVEP